MLHQSQLSKPVQMKAATAVHFFHETTDIHQNRWDIVWEDLKSCAALFQTIQGVKCKYYHLNTQNKHPTTFSEFCPVQMHYKVQFLRTRIMVKIISMSQSALL